MNKGDFKLSPESEKILSTVRPDLQRVIRRAAELTTVPFAVVSGNRTQAQQDYLYAQGRTRPGMVITWTRNSNHMGGGAIDFSAVDDKGKPTNHLKHTWNTTYYRPIAETILAAGKELDIPVEWPLWRKGDWGHIQLVKPYGKLPVLQSEGGSQGSRNTVVLSDNSKEAKEEAAPGVASPSVRGLQQSIGKSNVPNNAGPDAIPSAQTGKEGGRGGQGSLPTASYRPPAAGEQSVNLSRPEAAMTFLEGMGWEKHQAAALVANGVWESGGKDHLETRALGDKDKDGHFSAHGAYQWRGDRYSGPNGLLSFTLTRCPGHSSSEPWVQLRFAHHELTEGNEKRAGRLLKEAKTLEEATKAAISYLRPVGFTWEAPEKGHGFQRRLEIAQWIMGQRSTPNK
jgi:peptidoglycan L-alanyl-D-glutamate endopeptidase CwlK